MSTQTRRELPPSPNFWSLKGKNPVRSGLVINEQKYIICWLCSSRKKKMTAINIISVGVNCPELTSPKASWQTEGAEEAHSFHSFWVGIRISTGEENQHGGMVQLSILVGTGWIICTEINFERSELGTFSHWDKSINSVLFRFNTHSNN